MTSINHRNARATNNHSLYQTGLLDTQNSLLTDIKANTANVNINTDTLESLITSTNTLITSTNTKFDTSNNATLRDINNTTSIGDGSSNATSISLGYDRTNGKGRAILVDDSGRQQVNILGNTSGDGTGDNYHLHVDSNGIAKTQVVNAPTISVHSELNSGTNDNPRDSIAVGLRARQTITDESTETFLLTDNSGHLQIDVVNQPNVKLEDLSSSLNAQNASGTSRSVAVGLKGTTDISDVPTGSTFLLCDAQGHLQVDVVSGAGSSDASAANQVTINNTLTTIDGVLDNILSKNTDAETHLGNIETDLSNAETHLGNIESSLSLIDDAIHAEDSAHSSGHKGIQILGVRQSTQADFGADGDYVPFSINDDGEVRVTTGSGGIQNTTSSAKSHPTGTLTSSDALTVTNQAVNGITILCESNTLGSNFTLNNVKISSSSSGTYYALDSFTHLVENNSANAKIIQVKDVNAKFIKVEMTQSSGVARDVTYTLIV